MTKTKWELEEITNYAKDHTLKECAQKYNVSYSAVQTYLLRHHIPYMKEGTKNNDYKHGYSYTRLYRIWSNMKTRCYNEHSSDYIRYGARGIKVCEEWSNFIFFKDWALNNGYLDCFTLDRKDNNGNYCPENCRWVSRQKQSNNTRRNVFITYKGKTKTIAQWAEIIGLPYSVLYTRLYKLNWSIDRALGEE